jgi:hypothetical protein
MTDFLCTCGHERKYHADRLFEQPHILKSDCFFMMEGGSLCECLNFKSDNLKYLEQLYESRSIL